MTEPATRPDRPADVMITGMGVLSAFGRGSEPLVERGFVGEPAFVPVTRFDVDRRRAKVAAQLPGAPELIDELVDVVEQACTGARLSEADRAGCPLLLARHPDMAMARAPEEGRAALCPAATATELARRCRLGRAERTYTNACVAASTAVADAAAMIASGGAERAVVAAGYLLDPDTFALFDAGWALADDGRLRPFSARRRGLLLGDGVAAVVLESARAAARRGSAPLAQLAGWSRAGDAYHACQPHPEGTGMAAAMRAALHRAEVDPAEVGYVNAHGTGTPLNDPAETAALYRALGPVAGTVPVSSTKSVHGHTLEAAGLVELVVTVLALRVGRLPVNSGFVEPDQHCPLNLVLEPGRAPTSRHALSLNAAFGGANTALVVSAA